LKRALVTFVFAGVWFACAGQGETGRAGFAGCTAGQTQPCDCPGGPAGTQICNGADGTFGACACSPNTALPDAEPPPDLSHLCSARDAGADDAGPRSIKKCQVCDFDVDPSQGTVCPQAPACGNGNLGAPANPTLRADLVVHTSNGEAVASDGGTLPPPPPPKGTCLDPQLRIRLEKLKVRKAGGEAYCIIEANDGVTSEAAVTMKTSALKGKARSGASACPSARRTT
jgi:hypothetical protein